MLKLTDVATGPLKKRKLSDVGNHQNTSRETSLLRLLVEAADDAMSGRRTVDPPSPLVKPRLPTSLKLPSPKLPAVTDEEDSSNDTQPKNRPRTTMTKIRREPILLHHVNYSKIAASDALIRPSKIPDAMLTKRRATIGRPLSAHPILLTDLSPGETLGCQRKSKQ